MQIEQVPIENITPYSNNSKIHNDKQIKGIAESIKRFGFTQPIVLDNAGTIVIGHGRFEAAQMLGLKFVPILKLDGLNLDEVKALRLLDNKLNESAWDFELLEAELGNIDLDLTPFEAFDLTFINGNSSSSSSVSGKEVDPTLADNIKVCVCKDCGHEHSAKT